MVRTLLVALLVAFPAFAAEDFSARDSCKFLFNVFTDGNVTSAEADHCTADPAQLGANDISWDTSVTATEDAPTGSPAGADSTVHSDDDAHGGGSTGPDDFGSDDMTTGGWWYFAHNISGMWLVRFGYGGSVDGNFHTVRQSNLDTFMRLSGTLHSAVFPHSSTGNWIFLAWSHDAGSGSGMIRSYSSESLIANTLFDCTGGTQACNTEETPMVLTHAFSYNISNIGGGNFDGKSYELWYNAETNSHAEICQICRCGYKNDVRGVGRVDACNRCPVPAYEGCRRVID